MLVTKNKGDIIMTRRIYINERIEIDNVNEKTCELARVIKPYIEQINGMIELQDLVIMDLELSVDEESAVAKTDRCYEPGTGYVLTDSGMTLKQVTNCVISKDHDLLRLLDRLPQARKISLKIEYEMMHSKYLCEYGADFFEMHLKNMHDALSEYVTYKCCMHYSENDPLDTTHFYRFDRTFNGYVPYEKAEHSETKNRFWMLENFDFCISIDDFVKRQEVISVMQKKLEKYDISNDAEDDGYGNAFLCGNGFIDNGKIADLIAELNRIFKYVSVYDSEPDFACTAFTVDNDEFIAVRIFAEEGKIKTEVCYC